MSTKIFVNLPVKDLKRSIEFFGKLGYKFNAQFTDENAACLVISEDIFAMLLVEKFFKTFVPNKAIADTKGLGDHAQISGFGRSVSASIIVEK